MKAEFNNESLNGNNKKTEKIHYLGDLRIVGQVVPNLSSNEILGYVIMVEKTKEFKMYTVEQTKALLSKFKFVNAELKDNKIINTECSMSKLLKFNTNMMVIGNKGITVLGVIKDSNDNKLGFRVMDSNAVVVDLTEDDLLKLYSNGAEIINAKVVEHKTKTTISAIKQEFTKIEQSKLNNLQSKKKNPWINNMHVKKLSEYVMPHAIAWLLGCNNRVFSSKIYYYYNETYNYSYCDLDRETKIILKEVYTKNNGIELSNSNKSMLKKIVELKHNSILGAPYSGASYTEYVHASDDDNIYLAALSQFIILNNNYKDLVLKLLRHNRYRINLKNLEKLKNMGLASREVLELAKYAKEYIKRDKCTTNIVDTKRMFNTTTFTTGENIAQLGFAVVEQNRDYVFRTKTGNRKTLLYLGDVINNNISQLYSASELSDRSYDKYKKEARYLGDIATVAYLSKLLIKETMHQFEGQKEYIESDRLIASIEILIAIAFIYESKSVKLFVDDFKDDFEKIGVKIPDFDTLSATDYMLSPELKIYYTSGFNVFLNDNEYLKTKYKKSYLYGAKYINYRQLGVLHNIEHPILKNELASIVTMVTSNNCSTEIVEQTVGRLRFL